MFSEKTLKFLKMMGKQKSADWLDKHKDEYEERVRNPFQELVLFLGANLKREYPGFRFSPRSLSRPKRMESASEERGLYKDWIHCAISNTTRTRYEWPPCLYLSISPEEIFFGAGLYRPSSFQLRKVRTAISKDPKFFAAMLQKKSFRRHFPDGLAGEEMIRGPKGFDVLPRYRPLLMKKGYYVHEIYSKKEFFSKKFNERVVESCLAAQPLVLWLTRVTGGTPGVRKSLA